MCLIVFAYRVHPDFPLLVVGNRDEYHARAATPAAWWADHPRVFAGRDVQAGGTWMGVTRTGRFAALTNVRGAAQVQTHPQSRGQLVADFLTGTDPVGDYALRVAAVRRDYNGFNLLIGDMHAGNQALSFVSSSCGAPQALKPGVYGLSNASLDTPWPKLTRTVNGLKSLLGAALQGMMAEDVIQARLFGLMNDPSQADEHELPATGVPREWERTLSAPKIISPLYGTRATTVALLREDRSVAYAERTFDAQGNPLNTVQLGP